MSDIEPKAEIRFKPTWVFDLGNRDALLTLKALGGRLTEQEVVEAKELGDRLTLLRETVGRQHYEALVRAAAAVISGDFKSRKVP